MKIFEGDAYELCENLEENCKKLDQFRDDFHKLQANFT
jgi:hypothetical protein